MSAPAEQETRGHALRCIANAFPEAPELRAILNGTASALDALETAYNGCREPMVEGAPSLPLCGDDMDAGYRELCLDCTRKLHAAISTLTGASRP